MKWVAGVVILAGGALVVIGIKNTGGDICQVITGKPCGVFSGTSTATTPNSNTGTSTGTGTTPPSTGQFPVDFCTAMQTLLPGYQCPSTTQVSPPPLPKGRTQPHGGPTMVPDPTFHEPSIGESYNVGMLR